MRLKNIILLSIVICIVGIALFFVCKATYNSKVAELKRKTEEAFYKALEQELKSRNLECGVSFYSKSKTLKTDMPDSVYVEDETGRHLYRLDPKKSAMNITSDVNMRSLQSIAFLEKPINLDSFNSKWRKYLVQSGILTESTLCITVINNDTVTLLNKTRSEWCEPSYLMFTCYIGFGNEIEVIGYTHYSFVHIIGGSILFYLLIYVVCVCAIYKVGIAFQVRMAQIREKKIIREVIEVPVLAVNDTSIHSYILHENIIFYAERGIIEVNGVEQKIKPQLSRLLELFLKQKDNNYILEDKIMMQELWLKKCDDIRLVHKVITRLRVSFRNANIPIDIKRNGTDSYQLLL